MAPTPVIGRKKQRFNVHWYVVQQQLPLEEVLLLVQNEVQSKTLNGVTVRHAVDSFYFYCAQQAEKNALSDAFRRQVLLYFDQELFDDDSTRPFVLGKSLNEAVFGSVIKLQLAGGDVEAAWTLVNRLMRTLRKVEGHEAPKLHFRTVSPLLEHECSLDEFQSAYSKWQQLKQHGVEWTNAMEDVLVHMVIACVKQNERLETLEAASSSSVHFHDQMTSLLHDLQLACREVSLPNAQQLQRTFRAAGFVVETVPSDARMRSGCPSCGHVLSKQRMSELERAYMLSAIESRRSKVPPGNTVKEYLEPFQKWLMLRYEMFRLKNLAEDGEAAGKFLHYVLDGPNIAYINQNFSAGTYRLDQVDAVARKLQAQGHLVSITMPAAYLADKFVVRIRTKHFKEMRRQGKFVTRERTSEEKAILARWQEEDMIYSCRTDFLSDDLFWLYASVLMGREGRVVTNDQGRDHVFALLNGYTTTRGNCRQPKKSKASTHGDDDHSGIANISLDLLARWRDLTIVNIEIKHEEVEYSSGAGRDSTALVPIEFIRLLHPQPFSRVPQVTAPQHFHFPIADQATSTEHRHPVQNQRKRTRWLCAYREEAIN
uniref:PRORP domain-containing protein n=1 Tax=Peronospora matthiolae TaxID=2874970 RepID=A0AAV1UUJ6_9STRA